MRPNSLVNWFITKSRLLTNYNIQLCIPPEKQTFNHNYYIEALIMMHYHIFCSWLHSQISQHDETLGKQDRSNVTKDLHILKSKTNRLVFIGPTFLTLSSYMTCWYFFSWSRHILSWWITYLNLRFRPISNSFVNILCRLNRGFCLCILVSSKFPFFLLAERNFLIILVSINKSLEIQTKVQCQHC